ncbi:MAG TPA: TlpA disulfide reductase family protein, partial [Thermoanaerobaculia bacterium]|nr:TlpA disulfide reductase family protein [Thermoanaerobaculia bacterium]
ADLPFPAIELRELGGDVWRIPDEEHRTLFLRSWAAWCGPCREEASVVERLAAGFADREDVLFAYLSVDASESDVIELMARGEEPPLGFLVGGRSLLGEALPSVPTTWIVDGRGRIVAVQQGAATADPDGWLRGAREALLAAAAGPASPPAD